MFNTFYLMNFDVRNFGSFGCNRLGRPLYTFEKFNERGTVESTRWEMNGSFSKYSMDLRIASSFRLFRALLVFRILTSSLVLSSSAQLLSMSFSKVQYVNSPESCFSFMVSIRFLFLSIFKLFTNSRLWKKNSQLKT